MSNNDFLNNLSEKLAIHEKAQFQELDERIEALKRKNSAKGLLKSGATIKQVMKLCAEFFENMSQFAISSIKATPFDYEANLEGSLSQIINRFFPDDLGDIQKKLDAIVLLASGDHSLTERIISEVRGDKNHILDRTENSIEEFCLSLRKNTKFTTIDKVFLSIEGICLVIMAFLAGQWSVNPSGNYEPYIVFLGLFAPSLEFARRALKRKAT